MSLTPSRGGVHACRGSGRATLPICALTLVAGGHVVATVERIEEELTIDGFVYRLNPRHLPGVTASAQH